jgi:uncharacterized metal-binding protein
MENPQTVPGHKTHDKLGMYAAAALLPASYVALRYGLGDPPAAAYTGTLMVVGSHIWATWMLSPDLDIDSAIDDRWGPLRFLWLPYQKLTPHRSWFSHSGISGILRLLYLGAALWLLLALFAWIGQELLGIAETPAYHDMFFNWLNSSVDAAGPRPVWLLVAGVVIADLVHVGADLTTSELKWFGRSRRRRRR